MTVELDSGYVTTSVISGVLAHLWLRHNEPSSALQGLCYTFGIPILATLLILGTSMVRNSYLVVWIGAFEGATYMTIYLSSLLLSISLYRLSPAHPIHHIPGPRIFKLTKLAGIGLSYAGNQHLVFKQLHDRYGSVVRVGPNDVSISDKSAVNMVLGASGLPKGQYYKARQDPRAPSNLIVLQGEAHANRRRIWNRAMSRESLKGYEDIISIRAHQLSNKLAEKGGENIDLSSWITYFAFDFMGDLAFGGGFELLRDEGDRSGIWQALDKFVVAASMISHVPWLANTLNLVPLPARDRLRKFGVDSAMRRMRAQVTRKDIWYHLVFCFIFALPHNMRYTWQMDEGGHEKQKPALGDVISDGAMAIIAGADTTASALSSLFFLLLTNPKYLDIVEQEVMSTFPPDVDPIDTSKHTEEEMPWLHACLNETLRLYPPVPTNGPRQVPPDSVGRVIAGVMIPPGTQVYVPPYCLHRDEKNFSPHTDAFRPERWIKPFGTEYHTDIDAFIPFSYGPSNCAGRNLAMQEMLMVACLLIHRFKFFLAQHIDIVKREWPLQLHDHFVNTRGPLLVRLERRTSP